MTRLIGLVLVVFEQPVQVSRRLEDAEIWKRTDGSNTGSGRVKDWGTRIFFSVYAAGTLVTSKQTDRGA